MEAAEVRALAAQLVTPGLIVFPVRHHSPACALQLQRLFRMHSPSVVLVEGPRSFTPLVSALTDAAAKMPLAIYTYAVLEGAADEPERRRAAYYPFCDYSPELVALREARERGLPARFIDLDFAEQCGLEPERGEESDRHSLLDESRYRRSEHLHLLAQRLGCRDHEELWEHLFEADVDIALDEHIARVAAYCQLARVDTPAQEMTADGTLQREAEMAFHIREALGSRPPGAGPVLAVVGGFHAVALLRALADAVPRPKPRRDRIAEENAALIRYGFERLDRLNGYASGMTSPAWHQFLWEQMRLHEKLGDAGSPRVRRSAALTVLTDIAVELRAKHAVPLPMPALAAAYEQVLRLAQLRQRKAPLRNDVLDAVTSCFIQGDVDADGAIVSAVARRALCGATTGTVPPGLPRPPLVRDVEWRVRRQRLKIDDATPRRLVLELYRRPAHRITSRLLHGLSFLGIPFAARTAGPDFAHRTGLDRLQEHWDYTWSAATDGTLVEASVHGATLPLAVANRFLAQVDRLQAAGEAKSASVGARLMTQACVLGLHDHLPQIMALLRATIGEDAAFDSVTAAIANLALLWESREPLEARDLDELPPLLQAGYERAIWLGRELQGRQCEPQRAVAALSQLRELLASEAGRPLDAKLYWDLLAHVQQHHDAALLRGAAAGLRYAAGMLDEGELGKLIEGHFLGMAAPQQAVDFLRGLLETAREAAWQQPQLLGVLDGLLGEWSEDAFVANLPELRLAFAGMTPKETDRIAQAVARLHGLDELGPLVHRDLDAAQVQAHLQLSRTLVDVLAEDGLSEWVAS